MVSQQDIYAAWSRLQEAREAGARIAEGLAEAEATIRGLQGEQKGVADRMAKAEATLLVCLKGVNDAPKAVYQILGVTILRDGDRMEILPGVTTVM